MGKITPFGHSPVSGGVMCNKVKIMKKWILLCSLLFSQIGYAQNCTYTEESYSQWIMEYFRLPEPSQLECSLSYYSNSNLFLEKKNGRMPSAYFFAYAFNENSLQSLFEKLSTDKPLTERIFALHVFWVKNTEHSKSLLEKARFS